MDLAFEKKNKFCTSPDQYEPRSSMVKDRGSSWIFGSEKRPGLIAKANFRFPGVGTYDVNRSTNDGPRINMHEITDTVD